MRTLLLAATLLTSAVGDLPPTPKKPVVDTYFGDKVTDDYRWLEDWNDPAVKQWSEAENAHARKVLDALPSRPAIEKRLTQLLGFASPSYRAVTPKAGLFFALKSQPPKQQPFVVVLPTLDDAGQERVLVDPNTIDSSGATSIDFFQPSPDGKLVAVSLSQGGSESGTVRLYDVAGGTERASDAVPRANSGTAGGTLAWAKDASGFWYTRHPAPPEVSVDDDGFFQQVAFHKLGTSASSDKVELGAMTNGKRGDLVRTAENFLEASEDGRFVSDLVQKGDGGEFELWLRSTTRASKWRKVASFDDKIVASRFAPGGSLWLLSRKDAGKGKIIALPGTAASVEQGIVVVPEGKHSIESLEVTASKLFLVEQVGGPSRIHIVDYGVGNGDFEVPILPVSSVSGLLRVSPTSDDVVYENQSFTTPAAWFIADGSARVQGTALVQRSPVDMSDVVVTRHEATSKDGTKVPYTTFAIADGKKGAPAAGNANVWLTGYGGFEVAIAPTFRVGARAWLEQGGVVAVGNLRGGSEFGEAWHQAGAKTNKQHVFDDFIGIAEDLIARKVTTSQHLIIQGGSNGGLLMGAALTQRPELFKAVVAQVGYFDMLRYETKPNGAFNNTEYGSVANEAEYRALAAYSPYHHVKEGVKYPPTLFMTGANDPRVDPLHSRKMVARLQAVGADALLRTSGGTGHGGGTPLSARIAEAVDIHAFLFHELGVTYRAP